MIWKIFLIASLVVRSGVVFANASSSSGTWGGGQGKKDEQGHIVLRDLVSKNVCSLKFGSAFRKDRVFFPEVLENIAKVHWYLSMSIVLEADSLAICMVDGELNQIPDELEGVMAVFKDESGLHQVAYRSDNVVYISNPLFSAMDEKHRAYLLLHEITHSYIPMDEKNRYIKLMSFVKSVETMETTVPTEKEFAFALKTFGLKVPLSLEELESIKENLSNALKFVEKEPLRAIYHFAEVLRERTFVPMSSGGPIPDADYNKVKEKRKEFWAAFSKSFHDDDIQWAEIIESSGGDLFSWFSAVSVVTLGKENISQYFQSYFLRERLDPLEQISLRTVLKEGNLGWVDYLLSNPNSDLSKLDLQQLLIDVLANVREREPYKGYHRQEPQTENSWRKNSLSGVARVLGHERVQIQYEVIRFLLKKFFQGWKNGYTGPTIFSLSYRNLDRVVYGIEFESDYRWMYEGALEIMEAVFKRKGFDFNKVNNAILPWAVNTRSYYLLSKVLESPNVDFSATFGTGVNGPYTARELARRYFKDETMVKWIDEAMKKKGF